MLWSPDDTSLPAPPPTNVFASPLVNAAPAPEPIITRPSLVLLAAAAHVVCKVPPE